MGNGPSLSSTPLGMLRNEITFATNRIHLVYPETTWRPNFYVRAESLEDCNAPTETWADDMLIHLKDENIEVWCNLWFNKKLKELTGEEYETNVIKSCAHHLLNFDDEYSPHQWHLPILCVFGSSVSVAIQIAVKMGFGPIYLIGCDLGYGRVRDHFYPVDYEGEWDQRGARLANMNTLAGHMIAARSSSVPIINATMGGELEVYQRADLLELLEKPKL